MIDVKTESKATTNYRNFMTEAHRRFHDRIVADLNGILPICNQGKCTAADISDNLTEQQQITDLMQRVEQLCTHLSENVTDLFSHYYCERGRFCGAAYTTTAEIKVNLVDQSLMDRSADVRWWSKEPILSACVAALKKTSKTLKSDFDEMSAYLEGAIAAFRIPTLASSWTSTDISDRVQEVTAYFPQMHELMLNADMRAKFFKVVRSLLEMLQKGDGQEGTIKFAGKLMAKLEGCEKHIQDACRQLELIRSVYPSLYDIIVTDDQGTVIANARPERRSTLLGKNVASENWCQKSLKSGSNNTHIERAELKDEVHSAIVFSNPIRDPGDRQSGVLGTIAVFCDFQSEVGALLGNYLPEDSNRATRDGWYSFLTDEKGIVICSNEPAAIWPGSHCDLPRSHRVLSKGQSYWSHVIFKGRESVAFSACSSGTNSVGGSNWVSHLIAPSADIMQADTKESRLKVSQHQLMESKLIPEVSKSTYNELQDDRQAIKLISLNGILFASQLGKRGAALAPVFDKITATGDSATKRMESLLYEMASAEIELNLHLQETLAKQAVDLMSHKVLKRSLSLRLWSRTSSLRAALGIQGDQPLSEVENLLRTINDDYPVYRNIFLLNNSGEIKACSRPRRIADVDVRSVSDQVWFSKAMRSNVNDPAQIYEMADGELDNTNSASLVFAQSIPGVLEEAGTIGVIACLFDWQSEASEILNACLPKSTTGRPIPGAVAFIANRDQVVMESTNANLCKPRSIVPLPDEHYQLGRGKMIAGDFEYNGVSYIVASAKGDGFVGFDGLEWSAHVLRPLV